MRPLVKVRSWPSTVVSSSGKRASTARTPEAKGLFTKPSPACQALRFIFHFERGTGSQVEWGIHERTLRMARMPCAALEFAYPSEATLAAFQASRVLKIAKSRT